MSTTGPIELAELLRHATYIVGGLILCVVACYYARWFRTRRK